MTDQGTFKCFNCGDGTQDPNGDCTECGFPNGQFTALVALRTQVEALQAEFGGIVGWQVLLTNGQAYTQTAADLATARADIARLQGELAATAAANSDLVGKLRTAEQERDENGRLLAGAEGHVARLGKELDIARDDMTKYQQASTADLATARAANARLQGELAILRDELVKLRPTPQAVQDLVASLSQPANPGDLTGELADAIRDSATPAPPAPAAAATPVAVASLAQTAAPATPAPTAQTTQTRFARLKAYLVTTPPANLKQP